MKHYILAKIMDLLRSIESQQLKVMYPDYFGAPDYFGTKGEIWFHYDGTEYKITIEEMKGE